MQKSQPQTTYERYKTEVYRIGWRVQYRAKKVKQRECFINDIDIFGGNFTTNLEDKVMVEQLLQSLPPQGKTILNKVYIEGHTEEEVAKHLNMSQQAVNKWKKRMLKQLSQRMNSLN
ncbi:RNA polymerase sigma factor [Paenibacillus taichungensis]